MNFKLFLNEITHLVCLQHPKQFNGTLGNFVLEDSKKSSHFCEKLEQLKLNSPITIFLSFYRILGKTEAFSILTLFPGPRNLLMNIFISVYHNINIIRAMKKSDTIPTWSNPQPFLSFLLFPWMPSCKSSSSGLNDLEVRHTILSPNGCMGRKLCDNLFPSSSSNDLKRASYDTNYKKFITKPIFTNLRWL